MPEINGRYYANPAYGRAVERARTMESQAHARHGLRPKHHGHDDYDAATTPAGVSNQIYNETASLRLTLGNSTEAGSSWDLQQARIAVAHVIQNRATRKMPGGLAPSTISSASDLRDMRIIASRAYNAHGEARFAAHQAAKQSDPTEGAIYFYLDSGQGQPAWARGKTPVATFGPFENREARIGNYSDPSVPMKKSPMSRLLLALLTVLCILLSPPMPASIQDKRVSDRDMKALALAIEDEIYDEGCQGYGADASAGVQNESYELPLYIKPSLNDQDLGWAIYKFLPVGEVLRTFSVDSNGRVVVYGHPEWDFPPTESSYLTVYMNDDDLCQSKHDWVRTKFTIELMPSKERLREASARQKQRMGERYRAHKHDCSFSWR
jgi:hypothetical protein